MKQGLIFGTLIIIFSFLMVNNMSSMLTEESAVPEVVLIQDGEEIYSSPFLYEGKQVIWYIKEEDGTKKVLKDEEIIDYYNLNIKEDELVDPSKVNFDEVYKVSGVGSEINMIINQDGYVKVLEANCPDKIDVKLGKIYDDSKVITCAPHKLVIKIRGVKNKEGVDA